MTTELKILLGSILLGIFQILLAVAAATKHRGIQWNIGSREEPASPLPPVAARLGLAAENFKETFPFFLAAVVIVQFLSKNSNTTALGAQMYFFARVLYVPIYGYNITHVRTLVWGASMAGIGLLLVGACL